MNYLYLHYIRRNISVSPKRLVSVLFDTAFESYFRISSFSFICLLTETDMLENINWFVGCSERNSG